MGSTDAQITRVRDSMDVPYKLPSNAEFETSYAVFKASQGCLVGGSHRGRASSPRTLSNGSEPRLANPRERSMRRVHGPRADPYRMGHGRPLEQSAKKLTEAAIARGPGMGSMVRFTPPPCRRATRVVIEVEGSPERLHTGLGSGGSSHTTVQTHPRIRRQPSIVKLHVSNQTLRC